MTNGVEEAVRRPITRLGILKRAFPVAEPAARRSREDPILGLAPFWYYANLMSGGETVNGSPVTEEQITAWAAEAEAGYDVDALKRRGRGRGRPGRGAEPSQVVALRLRSDELAELDALAERMHKTRSELIREALAAYAA